MPNDGLGIFVRLTTHATNAVTRDRHRHVIIILTILQYFCVRSARGSKEFVAGGIHAGMRHEHAIATPYGGGTRRRGETLLPDEQ